MIMEDSAKLTKGISAVNYMRVAALMIYAALTQLAEYSILMGIRVRASDAAQVNFKIIWSIRSSARMRPCHGREGSSILP